MTSTALIIGLLILVGSTVAAFLVGMSCGDTVYIPPIPPYPTYPTFKGTSNLNWPTERVVSRDRCHNCNLWITDIDSVKISRPGANSWEYHSRCYMELAGEENTPEIKAFPSFVEHHSV